MAKNKIAPTEIELKYLLGQALDAKAVTEVLSRENFRFKQAQAELKNCYFDTPALDLARTDMGLRIRSGDTGYEQTIKTSGRVFSGLHQRPEYNIKLSSRQAQAGPVLSLFPAAIWLPGQAPAQIQEKLAAIFTTDFHRTSWTLEMDSGAVIELVLDVGLISAGETGKERQAAIAEFELELVSGSGGRASQDLLTLAKLLCRHFKIRPGLKSKAARGYALWLDIAEEAMQVPAFPEGSHAVCADLETFYSQLQLVLETMQQGVENYVLSPVSQHLETVKLSLLSLAQLFEQGSSHSMLALSLPGRELDEVIQAFREKCDGDKGGQGLIDFFHGQDFNRLQLAILALLLEKVPLSESS